MNSIRQLQKNGQIQVVQIDNQEELDGQKNIKAYHEVRLSRAKLTCAIFCGTIVLILAGFTLMFQKDESTKISIPEIAHTLDNPMVGDHDKKCYTQGLSFINRTHILQSCGIYGQSFFHILQYNREDGKPSFKEIYRSATFDPTIFLEGSIYFPQNKLFYFLTWRERIVIRFYEKDGKLIEKDRLPWRSQGWGLTHNGTHLFLSDGSDKIYVTTPELTILSTLEVVHQKSSLHVRYINELELVEEEGKQYIYANVYQQNTIVKIDSTTGTSVAEFDIGSLVLRQPQAITGDEVLNGIAYDLGSKRYILTGKKWKSFYIVDSL